MYYQVNVITIIYKNYIVIPIFESNQEHPPNTDVCMNADHIIM